MNTEKILNLVAAEWKVTVDELKSMARPPRLVIPRNAAVWIMREQGMKFEDIGWLMGGRDYATARYAFLRHTDEMSINSRVKQSTEKVMEALTHV